MHLKVVDFLAWIAVVIIYIGQLIGESDFVMGEISVITIPLKTEIWQEDVLAKTFEKFRQTYNVMLGYEYKQFRKLERNPKYIEAKEIIYSYYKEEDAEKKKQIKSSLEYKAAVKIQNEMRKEWGFTEFGFVSESLRQGKYFMLPSKAASYSIGKPMWIAFEKMFFGNGETVHFKKKGQWSSIASDSKSGLRIVGEDGKTVLEMDSREKYYCVYKSKQGKALKMPLKIDHKDLWLWEMMSRKIHVARITRKNVNGTYKYYVQLSVEGAPAIKYDKNGEIKHPIKEDRIGVYIDTTSVTIANSQGIQTINLNMTNDLEDEMAEIRQYMDNSRRATNPDNFNDDGTIKKGIFKDGQRRPLHWNYSHSYIKARNKLSNMLRVQKEQRTIRTNKIANTILAIGNNISVNDYPFQWAAQRKKETEYNEKTGVPLSKAKAGKKIAENAPASVIETLNKKLKARGYCEVQKVKLDVDKSITDYRSFYANELYRQLD